jgi:hypothetical protein
VGPRHFFRDADERRSVELFVQLLFLSHNSMISFLRAAIQSGLEHSSIRVGPPSVHKMTDACPVSV